jgi:hypothetical protein
MSASERPHDAGGPRPENQRRRAEIRGPRRSLIGLLVVVAVAAIVFVVSRRSDRPYLGMPAGYLAGSSGLVLAIVIAGTQATAAVLLLVHAVRARLAAAIAAGVLVASAVALIMSMLGVAWFPAVLFFIGFVELLLVAGATPRKAARRKHQPGRR